MPIDPTVIAVLLSAIEKDPENTALRLHLVSLLFDSGRPGDMDEALKHCAVILTSQPDHTEALDYPPAPPKRLVTQNAPKAIAVCSKPFRRTVRLSLPSPNKKPKTDRTNTSGLPI